MKIQDYMIGMLIIGGGILAVLGFMYNLAAPQHLNVPEYHPANEENLERGGYNYTAFDKVDKIYHDWEQTKDGMEEILGSDENKDYPNFAIGLWERIKGTVIGIGDVGAGTAGAMFGGLTLGFDMITGLGKSIALPSWVTSLLYAALMIMVIIILYQFLSGRKQ